MLTKNLTNTLLLLGNQEVSDAVATPVYLVCGDRKFDNKSTLAIEKLLNAKKTCLPKQGKLVITKPGLISRWSTITSEILASCNLGKLNIQRAKLYKKDQTLQVDDLLEDLLCDEKMSVWIDSSFQTSSSKPTKIKANAKLSDQIQNALSDLKMYVEKDTTKHMEDLFTNLDRAPTIAEIAVLAQFNCDHCRHRTFNAKWQNNKGASMMEMIRSTNKSNKFLLGNDNSSILEITATKKSFGPSETCNGKWGDLDESAPLMHTLFKAETHNHPTGLTPFEGAATGIGGEIRDETASGIGGSSLAGFAGYIVSKLNDDATYGQKKPMEILQEAPLGVASFANEFGRPTIAGFFRTMETSVNEKHYGFIKPMMLVGGIGEIRDDNLFKQSINPDDALIHVGGGSARIGISGATASSTLLQSSTSTVQRADAQMQRRAQELINACALKKSNPIKYIHDVGAGGIANCAIEIVLNASQNQKTKLGCELDLNEVPLEQKDLNSVEILCNEAQERYLVVVDKKDVEDFFEIAQSENCPVAIIGKVNNSQSFIAKHLDETCIDIPLEQITAKASVIKAEQQERVDSTNINVAGLDLTQAGHQVLAHPSVADKSYLATICDRSVGGLVSRDQFVGKWQTAVADCAVIKDGHFEISGKAFAVGERPILAIHNPASSAKVAIAEALTNLAASNVGKLSDIKLCLNWMGNAQDQNSLYDLHSAVEGVCKEFLLDLDLAVVAGKDSLSMSACKKVSDDKWQQVSSPSTCIASVCGHVNNVNATLTPQLSDKNDTILMLLEVDATRPLGGTIIAELLEQSSDDIANVNSKALLAWWNTMAELRAKKVLLAYHDVSDGGVFTTACEMAFAANRGITLVLDTLCQTAMELDVDGYEQSSDNLAPGAIGKLAQVLFNEAPAALIEVCSKDAVTVLAAAKACGMKSSPQTIGRPATGRKLRIYRNAVAVVDEPIDSLKNSWSSFAHYMRSTRDDHTCAEEEANRNYETDLGLYCTPTVPIKAINPSKRKIATVLRGQGCNGYAEMAAALHQSGFEANVLSINELLDPKTNLDCELLVLPGGFSYADVLGAGFAQAQIILQSAVLKKKFTKFFARQTLTLGVCNGCQILSNLGELFEKPTQLPKFVANRSKRFEARLTMVEVLDSPSAFFAPLAGSRLIVPVSCDEGRTLIMQENDSVAALRFLGPDGLAAIEHPYDPLGCDLSVCGFTTKDGKITFMMPHPERATLSSQLPWSPESWANKTCWQDFFVNAYHHLNNK